MVIYLSAMHLMVFVVLYYITHTVHYGCDPGLTTAAQSNAVAAQHVF